MVFTKIYESIPVNRKEILRYAGCKDENGLPPGFLDSCLNEAGDKLNYKVCYIEAAVKVCGDICDFGAASVRSTDLCKNLKDVNRAVVFAATVGAGIDRLIAKYGATEPSRAVMLGAIGAERIEALCDTFCADIAVQTGLFARPRFSPGYGDLPLTFQKDIFALLNCNKHIGLGLNGSMLMSPSKSVTAIFGLNGCAAPNADKCAACEKRDCAFRGEK